MVLPEAREARFDWNNDIFFVPIAPCDVCRDDLLLFAVGFRSSNALSKTSGTAFTGFATVVLLELIIGSLLMISLGIIGEYLACIYEEVKGRPRYIVSESIERDQ